VIRGAGVAVLCALLGAAGPASAGAQHIVPKPELRADLLGAAPYSVQVGGGVNLGAGYYQRLELDVAAGCSRARAGRMR